MRSGASFVSQWSHNISVRIKEGEKWGQECHGSTTDTMQEISAKTFHLREVTVVLTTICHTCKGVSREMTW